MKKKQIVIVGAGLSGLTAGAYLLRAGHGVTILEKSAQCGGLVSSFERDGFLFDTGPRAFGNAGILVPMLEDLGIDLELVGGPVSIGIENSITDFDPSHGIQKLMDSLHQLFPGSRAEIQRIEAEIRHWAKVANILNRVANPCFKNPFHSIKYLLCTFLPWFPAFLRAAAETSLNRKSIEAALDRISGNASLKDMLSQHFFKGTPAHFAFGYYENFLDYLYPCGGTGRLPQALKERVISAGGKIFKSREVSSVLPTAQKLLDQDGREIFYDSLLWTADLKSLFLGLAGEPFRGRIQRAVQRERDAVLSAQPGESVFTLFLAVDEKPAWFRTISHGHFIYTPLPQGLGGLHREKLKALKDSFSAVSREELFNWLKNFCERNSYEISIPVLKDSSLAPGNQTGLVISLLCDGELFQLVDEAGWLEEFREKMTEYVLSVLERSIYPDITKKILFVKSSTPLTLVNRFNSSGGAITGWSLEGKPPVPDSLAGIIRTPRTAVPHIYKAGQWSYSPSGVPVALLTGRIAAAFMK